MNDQILLVLYVRDVADSARFYAALLESTPQHLTENYAQFDLKPGIALSLWRLGDVIPACDGAGCRTELNFGVENAKEVEKHHERYRALGVTILQKPILLDFGTSMLACDPDGHRLRVIAPPG